MSASKSRVLARSVMLLCALPFLSLHAQAPNEQWRTIRTAHFDVHFPAPLEEVARRGAGSAERAYSRLSHELKPARGRIDLVISDNVDDSNGFAYVSPTPRIVVFARPPVDDRTLRFRDDWLDLVIQHELVHVFHLDRTRGWWRAAQFVFGRQPLLFPNAWAPSWMLEGLAVYYESRLGAGGRLEGKAHEAYVSAKALDRDLPRFGALSAATLDFPGGNNAYIFGSLLVQQLSDRHGPYNGTVGEFVERSSGRLNPFTFNGAAKKAFGASFSEQWRQWMDSVRNGPPYNSYGPANNYQSTARPLTKAAWYARFPRVDSSGAVLFVASNGRDVAGLYELPASLDGPPRRIARRNSMEPNVRLADGRVIFAQSEWLDPYRLRSDLWVREVDGRERALTRGARLFAPDARRRDGAVVAVQNVPGGTRLVRVEANGDVRPITSASLDTNWSAPRWSHDGTRIAATRWVRGGEMNIFILSPEGAIERQVTMGRRFLFDTPAWSPDDATLYFTARTQFTGALEVWRAQLANHVINPGEYAVTSLDSPEGVANGFLAVETRGRGERLVVGSKFHTQDMPDDGVWSVPDMDEMPPAPPASGAVRPYRPWRQLIPRFWLPSIETTDENRTRYGAWVGGSDIVGRHAYAASLTREPDRGEQEGSFAYRYAGFGLPLVDVAVRQTWDHSPLADSTQAIVGALARRRRFAGASLTLIRQRVRNVAVLSGGAELEWRDFVTDPAPLINRLGSPLFLQTLKYPTFTAAAGWANTRSPILAFGPEDGVALSVAGRWRYRTDDAAATRSSAYVGTAAAYKSVGVLPGPWHHVIALRGAMGTTDDKTNTELEAGGVSGSSAEVAPGLVIGDVRRTFAVRGFAPGAQRGIRAFGASAEWRAPLAIPSWGTGFLPLFAQRVTAIAFTDVGAAWCPAGSRTGTIGCPHGETPRTWMRSVGGELTLDATVLNYDSPYRMRVGYARPVQGKAYADSPNGSMYFSLGLSF